MLASISALPIADTKEGESVVFPLRSLGRVLGVEVHFGYYTTPRDLHEICGGCERDRQCRTPDRLNPQNTKKGGEHGCDRWTLADERLCIKEQKTKSSQIPKTGRVQHKGAERYREIEHGDMGCMYTTTRGTRDRTRLHETAFVAESCRSTTPSSSSSSSGSAVATPWIF